ncbi:MAG: DUF3592 domain-containing protein [Planctomycetes bacterium]|nr:DUF3592 domain-containing protein [Planctomycetota bacterium]
MKSGWRGKLALWIGLVLLFALGAANLYRALVDLLTNRAAARWPQVSATLVRSSVDRRFERLDVEYAFTYQDKPWSSQRYGFDTLEGGEALLWAAEHPVGSSVVAHVNVAALADGRDGSDQSENLNSASYRAVLDATPHYLEPIARFLLGGVLSFLPGGVLSVIGCGLLLVRFPQLQPFASALLRWGSSGASRLRGGAKALRPRLWIAGAAGGAALTGIGALLVVRALDQHLLERGATQWPTVPGRVQDSLAPSGSGPTVVYSFDGKDRRQFANSYGFSSLDEREAAAWLFLHPTESAVTVYLNPHPARWGEPRSVLDPYASPPWVALVLAAVALLLGAWLIERVRPLPRNDDAAPQGPLRERALPALLRRPGAAGCGVVWIVAGVVYSWIGSWAGPAAVLAGMVLLVGVLRPRRVKREASFGLRTWRERLRAGASARPVRAFLGTALFLLGAYLGVAGWHLHAVMRAASSWPTVQGTLVKAEFTRRPRYLGVLYTFEVDGTPQAGTEYGFSTVPRDAARDWLRTHRCGSALTVYVNPDPATSREWKAVLDPKHQDEECWLRWIGSACTLVIGALLFAAVLRAGS